jgi:HD-GYP domain-containing protein (c-di-GMP phosphodiesterase class II)
MAINYKKELESAAKTMILVHEPDMLIKMIARILVQKVNVRHAGILLHHRDRDTYILTVSRGSAGLKIPAGFARMDSDNALVRFFREHKDKEISHRRAVVFEEAQKVLKKKSLNNKAKQLLKSALYQMEIFEAEVCIPSFFRNDLLGVLLLGNKKNGRKFDRHELDFFTALTSDVAMAIRNAQLFKDLALELDKKKRLFIHTTVALAAAIDAKDHYTHGHTSRVTGLSLEIAKKLAEKNKTAFNEKFLENLHIASLLHDIGKIGVPESILNKVGPLNESEMKKIQEHPQLGLTILQPIKELEDSILGVKYHHEKYDGSGYPEGLSGAQIPLIASIISVADSFDAMTTDRPYRKAFSKEEAVKEIKRQSGKQFDPQIASALVELYHEKKI